jgi:hypothetical protein
MEYRKATSIVQKNEMEKYVLGAHYHTNKNLTLKNVIKF